MSIEQHVTYALRNAPLKSYPFPHFYARDVFPVAVYDDITEYLKEKKDFTASEFGNRTFADKCEVPGCEFMLQPEFCHNVMSLFREQAAIRFQKEKLTLSIDLRLVRDAKDYKIGPHTDTSWKVVSLLFYLPPYSPDVFENAEYGTRLYVPKDRKFQCAGGPHYPFDDFEEVTTMDYLPNRCFGFFRTNQSFHGVPPLPVQFHRDVLLYNIYYNAPKGV